MGWGEWLLYVFCGGFEGGNVRGGCGIFGGWRGMWCVGLCVEISLVYFWVWG